MKSTIRRLCLVFAFVLVIVISAVTIWGNPTARSGSDYIARQQSLIRTLNTPMPLLGAVTILLGLISAFSNKRGRDAFAWWITGAVLLIISGLITRFCNQPINAVVMTWDPAAPPPNWQVMRDTWWHWHQLRLGASLAGFAAFLVGYIRGRRTGPMEIED